MIFDHILIISDIEGSSGCWSYEESKFMGKNWPKACVSMSLDVDAVVKALFKRGVKSVIIKDFHRTGYNLFPKLIDKRAKLVSGYQKGPVPGIGDPGPAGAVMFLGMHGASGSKGFLAHTLTSRIKKLEVNGKLFPEVALFASSLAPFGIRPVFFSGTRRAAAQAKSYIPGIRAYAINKSQPEKSFDAEKWRKGLAMAAAESLDNKSAEIFRPKGPFHAVITMRDGKKAAQKAAKSWNFDVYGDKIFISRPHISELYMDLIRLC